MAFSGFAQDLPGAVSYTAKKGSTPTDKTVELTYGEEEPVTVITAKFLDNTSKGSTAGAGTWNWSGGNWATADQNGLEVQFTPQYGGVLAIKTAAAIATNKSVWMFVDEDTENTMDATYGDVIIPNGVNLADTEFGQEIPSNSEITYQLQKGRTYNFYFAGTKWRLAGFTFTATDDNDPDAVDEDVKLAFIGDMDEDDLAFAVASGFDASTPEEVSYEALQDYKAVLVSNKITKDSPWAEVLRKAVAYVPMVNLSADLIEAWGLGSVADSETGVVTVAEENIENPVFADLSIEEDGSLELLADGVLPIVTPGDYLKNDVVLATIGEAAYMLQHTSTSGKNTHILIPLKADANTMGDVLQTLVPNALKVAAKTYKTVSAANKPTITPVQENLMTIVTIASNQEGAVIRYTVDGSEPTAESPVYSEPLTFTEPATVKAYADGVDGFNASAVASAEVKISAKAAAPLITLTPGDKSVEIKIEAAEEGAQIYFSFAGQDAATREDKSKTEQYTGAFTVTEPTTVYAFVVGDNLLQSDLAEEKVIIPGLDATNIRLDVESHFYVGDKWIDGTSAQYVGMNGDGEFGVSSAHKNAWNYYTEGKEANPDSYHEYLSPKEGMEDWKIVSEGTTFAIEPGTNSPANISGNAAAGYAHAIEMIDKPASVGVLSWKSVSKFDGENEPNTGRVESTRAFTAPFDVVTYIKNSSSNSESTCKLYISKDGKEWTSVKNSEGEDVVLACGPTQRQTARTRVSVEDEGSYYVKVAHGSGSPALHDIYIYTNGEESKNYSGIEDVIATEGAEVIAVEYYNLGGVRIAEPTEGFFIRRATLSNGQVVVEKVVK